MRNRSTNKWDKRDHNRHKNAKGMAMHNKGLKSIMAEQEAQAAIAPIESGVTRFKCGRDTMIVVRKSKRSASKWSAAQDAEGAAYTLADFQESYIRKHQIEDKS